MIMVLSPQLHWRFMAERCVGQSEGGDGDREKLRKERAQTRMRGDCPGSWRHL